MSKALYLTHESFVIEIVCVMLNIENQKKLYRGSLEFF